MGVGLRWAAESVPVIPRGDGRKETKGSSEAGEVVVVLCEGKDTEPGKRTRDIGLDWKFRWDSDRF